MSPFTSACSRFAEGIVTYSIWSSSNPSDAAIHRDVDVEARALARGRILEAEVGLVVLDPDDDAVARCHRVERRASFERHVGGDLPCLAAGRAVVSSVSAVAGVGARRTAVARGEGEDGDGRDADARDDP
jgi:hypothetical protein